LIEIDVMGEDNRRQSIEAVLDTGFSGYLTLPWDSIRGLGLQSAGQRAFELANGEQFEFNTYLAMVSTYLAMVSWHERLRLVTVLESDSVPLLGAFLLWGNRVTLDMLDDGDVAIDELFP
jgi:predicted aspartyl protease